MTSPLTSISAPSAISPLTLSKLLAIRQTCYSCYCLTFSDVQIELFPSAFIGLNVTFLVSLKHIPPCLKDYKTRHSS